MGGCLTLTITLVVGFQCTEAAVNKAVSDELPTGKVDVQSLMDTVLDFIHDLGKGVIGEKRLDHFFMFFSDCFFLFGLVT